MPWHQVLVYQQQLAHWRFKMRFLKTQTLNKRMIYDSRVALDTANNLTLATSNSMILPSSQTVISNPVAGQMRYNTNTAFVEVYQGSTWRSLRFRESTKIVLQSLGNIDGYSYYYGPLNGAYNPTNVASDNDNFNGQNILVFAGNVFQIYNTNYTITQNPVVTKALSAQAVNGATTLTVSSTATIPTGSTVTGSASLQANTIATVTDATTITLSKSVSGSTIANGTTLTFTSPAGYYLNFSADAQYSGLGFNSTAITVLHGFDR